MKQSKKKQKILRLYVIPHIKTIEINNNNKFTVYASDCIWNIDEDTNFII